MPRNQSARPRASAPAPTPLRRSNSSLAAPAPKSQAVATPDQPRAPVETQSSGIAGGLIANVASTAAGVAIGHSIGHAITGLFGGNGASDPAPQANIPPSQEAAAPAGPCGFLMKELTQCIELNGKAEPCQWIFDQLNLCQRAAQSNKDI